MTYKIAIKKKTNKNLKKLPNSIKEKFLVLAENLEESGPVQSGWPNYSKLGKNEYHCHLSRSWIACWRHEKNTIIIEVYYVGSREKAPY
ncbi:MAG: hypothetical protein HN379_12010 [Desulfobacteraceae bacterium]|jgi:mRNA-degrading endonuclease RelE of RelBE toxin-antitoxin system|nr:hypothetical protein [Desulfobacteraceae bacterium]